MNIDQFSGLVMNDPSYLKAQLNKADDEIASLKRQVEYLRSCNGRIKGLESNSRLLDYILEYPEMVQAVLNSPVDDRSLRESLQEYLDEFDEIREDDW